MKKIILASLMTFFSIFALSAQQTTFTPAQIAIIQEEVNKAVDTAVQKVVIDYEKKIVDYKQQLLDKDIVITNVTVDRDIAQASAVKFEKLYNIERAKSTNNTLIIIGVGVLSAIVGYGINAVF